MPHASTPPRRGRPPAEAPLDHLIQLKVNRATADALKRLAAANDRTTAGELRHALRLHLEDDDARRAGRTHV